MQLQKALKPGIYKKLLTNKTPKFRAEAYWNLDDPSLSNYVRFAWGDVEPNEEYMHNWHIDAICEHLEAVTNGEITKLIINLPPRFCKSTLAGVMWPTWTWTQKPYLKYLCSSYAGNLAIRDNIKSKLLIQSEWYQMLFGDRYKLVTELQEKIQNDKNGYRLASSVGGSATGEGGDIILCLGGETNVETDKGTYPIGYIVQSKLPVTVWSYNLETKQKELKEILNYHKKPKSKMILTVFTRMKTVRSTLDHEFYIVGKGYVKACDLRTGNRVLFFNECEEKVLFQEPVDDDESYDLEVKDNHNFYANSILVHNCDDAHKIEEVESDQVRNGVLEWWDQTMNTRLNNPKKSARVIIMQRLHEDDLVGHLLASNQGYTHLCLPMEYEGEKYFTEVNWTNPFSGVKGKYSDPRTQEGELLFPKRYGAKETQGLKDELMDYGYASKYQQKPVPKGGAMFSRNWFRIEGDSPIEIKKCIRYWDKAGTAGGGAYTVGVRMVLTLNGRVFIEDVVRAQLADLEREELIRQTAGIDRMQRPNTEIWLEQEPGSGGKDAAAASIRNLAGFLVYTERPTGDKMARASPLASYAKAGNVFLISSEWNEAFLREFEFFPRGKYKDQVDASSGAFNKLFTGGFAYNVGE